MSIRISLGFILAAFVFLVSCAHQPRISPPRSPANASTGTSKTNIRIAAPNLNDAQVESIAQFVSQFCGVTPDLFRGNRIHTDTGAVDTASPANSCDVTVDANCGNPIEGAGFAADLLQIVPNLTTKQVERITAIAFKPSLCSP